MASLKFIMDVDDEQQPDSRGLHKSQDPAASAHSNQVQAPSSLAAPHPTATTIPGPSHVSSPGDVFDQRIPSPAVPGIQISRRGGPSPRGSLSTATSSTSTTLSRDPTARRRSTTSNDSMDQGGYGSTASSSSMGGSLNPSNSPMRPMPNSNPTDMPIKLTPITGRVSRAKKGVPVHTCDICKPSKTFTRAEHLRRHQLSHQTPGFPCRYPGCDRAFHRSDLLTRHQQRHDQEGDKLVTGSEEETRRTSLASSRSQDDAYGSPSVLPGQGTGAPPSSVPQDLPSTPNPGASQPSPYTRQLGSSPAARQMGGAGGGYGSPAPGPQDYTYTLSPRAPTVSVIHPSRSIPGSSFVMDPYQQPRTTPLFIVTRGLSPSPQIPDSAPDLYHHDNSPYVSSASDSTYSTPASEISRGTRLQWMPSRPSPQPDWTPQLLSPYPGAGGRELSGPNGDVMASTASPLFVNPFSPSPHFTPAPPPHPYGTMLDVSMTGYPSAADAHPLISPSPESAYRAQHGHHGHAATSVRSPTPPPNTSSHTSDTLVTPTPALPSRIDSMASLGRQKEVAVEIAGEHPALVGMDVLAGLGSADFSSPGGTGDGTGSLVALDLPMGGGCGAAPTATVSLPRPVRAAIPGYLEVYWGQFHRLYPVVHRATFEAGSEDVLRCAMAAVATQYLGSRDDRNRGNQLHEYAWNEARRVPQWSLQTMQAILLCEFFARFRGRKAATRPSKLFESLSSRVSSPQFFASSSRSDNPLALLDARSTWSPASSPGSSSSSESGCVTPTSASPSPHVNTLRHAATFPTHPFSTFSSFASFSHSGSLPLFPSSYYAYNVSSLNVLPTSAARAAAPKASLPWSSLFAPDRRPRRAPHSLPLSQVPFGTMSSQTYLPYPATQVLYDNPSMFDPAVLNSDQHVTTEDRWHAWLNAEARRRLLTACLLIDTHTSVLQQQRRAHDYGMGGNPATLPPIPLTIRSSALWEAESAEQWSDQLEADPSAGSPTFAPQAEMLTSEDVRNYSPFDRAAILAVEILRLPVAVPQTTEFDLQVQHASSAFHTVQAVRGTLCVEAENRISSLFAGSATANTYLAMHHTPLHDLLAVSGDSWVFSQKVLPANSFIEHKKNLKQWAEQPPQHTHRKHVQSSGVADLGGMDATKATIYAARAILAFLARPRSDGTNDLTEHIAPALAGWGQDISDYWGLYVCALICWAFGHCARSGSDINLQYSPAGSAGSADEAALAWLRQVSNMSVEEVASVRARRDAGSVVGLVRRRLDMDCVGGRSRLYVDAVGVLKKLEEGASWKWF